MSIITSRNSFPRDLDVLVNVSRPQVETTTDLTTAVTIFSDLATSNIFTPAERVRFYTSLESVERDFNAGHEARAAARAFFSQSPRSRRWAIASVDLTNTPGALITGALSDNEIRTIASLDNQDFDLRYAGAPHQTRDADFRNSEATVDASADAIAVVLSGQLVNGRASWNRTTRQFIIITNATGDVTAAEMNFLQDASTTSFATAIRGTEATGAVVCPARNFVSLADELSRVDTAAGAAGRYLYGWSIERTLRTTANINAVADWIAPRRAVFAAAYNGRDAYNSAAGSDPGSVLAPDANERVLLIWSDRAAEYPDVALLAYALHVDYAAVDSTITLKFKDLNGISPASISQTQLDVLEARRYNVLTLIGNSVRTLRDGVTADPQFWADELLILDNLREEIQVAVYNVFVRERKVPYTTQGVNLLRAAITRVCQRYVINGALAQRAVNDASRESGPRFEPPFTITSQDLALISDAQRQARTGPTFTVEANLAGAIHSVTIEVQAFA